jgi:spore coat polysaccharide biosynthesis predicted glycosyltransferase SpsG
MPLCRENQIRIVIVTGPGYRYIDKLGKELLTIKDVDVEYTHAAGVMSSIMERSDIAITSNGRTVYELAHMNIPAIILSHHQRENTHVFAKEENGFIPIGTYDDREKKKKLSMALQRLVQDVDYRRSLFNKMSHFRFNNKNKVKKLILNILER